METASIQRLLQHARRLFTLSDPEDILAASCREIVALTGATRAFASCCLPRERSEDGIHLASEGDRAEPVTAAACAALLALQGGLPNEPYALERADAGPIFAGLACSDEITRLQVVPIVHRTGQVWGAFVLIAATAPDAPLVAELVQHTAAALDNAQHLASARRDQDRLLLLAEATEDALYDWDLAAPSSGGAAASSSCSAPPATRPSTRRAGSSIRSTPTTSRASRPASPRRGRPRR